jgi:hypothetical protein
MTARREFEMTDADLKGLLEACRSVPLIALQCGMPSSPQENANRAWCALGDRMGFDGMTVEPSSKGQRFFTAVVKPEVAS